MSADRDRYTRDATTSILRAARSEHDFAGWIAGVLAAVAGQLGSSDALTAGRPGSWEASHVDQLVKGTVGYDDAHLPRPMTKLTDARAREIRDRCRFREGTRREIAADSGVSLASVNAIATGRTWKWLARGEGNG